MDNRWDDALAPPEPLAQCVYGSRLLGADPALVLHGGGNTSVKTTGTDVTGEPVEVLHVKGSGWDLATIEAAGFAPLRLDRVRALLRLERLGDRAMMNQLRCALLDSAAPDPSVESLLHALLPHPAVLHSHADALVALTDTTRGEALVREVYGDDVVVVPYVMPGFDLARACAEIYPRRAHAGTLGMVLLNHGLFTFGADTAEAYHRHIALVERAEKFLGGAPSAAPPGLPQPDPVALATLRRDISDAAGVPMVLRRWADDAARRFVARPDLADVATRGPATPDHVIRTKRVPLVGRDVASYADAYRGYVDAHRARARTDITPLDPAPRVVLDRDLGLLTAGRDATATVVAGEIYLHTIDVIERAEAVDRYRALPAADIFDVEYWDLEQAKLRRAGPPRELAGEVVLVTGAASGIGAACAEAFLGRGAAVVGVDLDGRVAEAASGPAYVGVVGDVCEPETIDQALGAAVDRFGGVDVVVVSAGVFPAARPLAEPDAGGWRRTFGVNVDAVAALFGAVHPLLALAPRGGRVAVVASKNVPAPGPGAAAYSASKAALTQLARVAALEWAADRIRVNVVHPDAVFDTGLWSRELIAERAARYGLTPEAYRTRNLLRAEVSRHHVAAAVAALCSDAFAVTTGAQVPVDGGNDRVI